MKTIKNLLNRVLSPFNLRLIKTTNLEQEIGDLEEYRQNYVLRLSDDLTAFDQLAEKLLDRSSRREK